MGEGLPSWSSQWHAINFCVSVSSTKLYNGSHPI
jgi:hypothetical protein